MADVTMTVTTPPDTRRASVTIVVSSDPGLRTVLVTDRLRHVLTGLTTSSGSRDGNASFDFGADCPSRLTVFLNMIPLEFFPLLVDVSECGKANVAVTFGPFSVEPGPEQEPIPDCNATFTTPPSLACLEANRRVDGAAAALRDACARVRSLTETEETLRREARNLIIASQALAVAAAFAFFIPFGVGAVLAGLMWATAAILLLLGLTLLAQARDMAASVERAIHILRLAEMRVAVAAARLERVCCPEHRLANVHPEPCMFRRSTVFVGTIGEPGG